MRAPLKGLLVAFGVTASAAAGWVALDDWRLRREIEELRGDLRALRASSDSCRVTLGQEEMLFREYDGRVDSLRDAVKEYESLDPEGVPAETYGVYLEAFERYNRSVPAWRMQVDSLRAHWEACREKADAHNAKADSLRLRLRELDLTGGEGR